MPGGHSDRPIVLADLTADLLWPKVLRSVGLALRPGRVLLAFVAIVAAGLCLSIPVPWEEGRTAWQLMRSASFGALTFPAGEGIAELVLVPLSFVVRPVLAGAAFATQHPLAFAAFGLPALFVVTLFGAAISRLASADFAHGVGEPWTRALAFALGRWPALLVAVLGPLALIAGFAAINAVLGWGLLRWPGVRVVGALFYGGALLTSAVSVFLFVVYVVGWPLLLPAVICEGRGIKGGGPGDGIDGIQRAYAYVPTAPLRYLAFAALLVAQLYLLHWLVFWMADATVGFARWSASAMLPEEAARLALGSPVVDGSQSVTFAARVVEFWERIPGMLAASVVLSALFCGCTVLYLAMRRVCDGQDEHDVWLPGIDLADAPGGHAPRPRIGAGVQSGPARDE